MTEEYLNNLHPETQCGLAVSIIRFRYNENGKFISNDGGLTYQISLNEPEKRLEAKFEIYLRCENGSLTRILTKANLTYIKIRLEVGDRVCCFDNQYENILRAFNAINYSQERKDEIIKARRVEVMRQLDQDFLGKEQHLMSDVYADAYRIG